MKFTLLKYIIQWGFLCVCVYLEDCATISANSRMFTSPTKEVLHPLAATLHSLLSHPLAAPNNHHPLSVSVICLFWIFHIKGIIQYGAFCAWLLSLSKTFSSFIHVAVLSVLHHFLWLKYIPLYGNTSFCFFIHQLMGIWVASTLGLLCIPLL